MSRVEWLQPAVDELTSIWLKSDSMTRRAITLAARQIENGLSVNPQEEGESRPERRRILFAEHLAVVFEVDEANELATMVTDWQFGRRRGGQPWNRGCRLIAVPERTPGDVFFFNRA